MEEKKPKIIVDKRERDFSNILFSIGAEVEEKMLEVGDFICSEKTVVERKTRKDFESSVMDKRLFVQLQNSCSHFQNVIIVVEGKKEKEGALTYAALMGAYVSIITDFGASLFFTKNIKSTAELLFAIAKHEQLGKKLHLPMCVKRKCFTLAQTQRAVLESLPMIGPQYAKKLLLHFGSLSAVFNASENDFKELEGIGEKKAKAIWRTIHTNYNPSEDA